MIHRRIRRLSFWTLAFALALMQSTRSDGYQVVHCGPGTTSPTDVSIIPPNATTDDLTCKVYPLADLGADPKTCKWVVDTIPQVIAPATWNDGATSKHTITYNPEARLMVVCHSAAVHAKIATFLESLKKAMPAGQSQVGKAAAQPAAIMPAQYLVPPSAKSCDPSAIPPGYAVPVPQQQPKHLFHFIVRYEGDGIIDSNVVEFMKAQFGGQKFVPPVAGYSASGESLSPPACSGFQCLPQGMPIGPGEGYFVPTCPAAPAMQCPPSNTSGGTTMPPTSSNGPGALPVMPMADDPPAAPAKSPDERPRTRY